MKSVAANWFYYVQVDCANDADGKGTPTTIERIVQQAASGIAPTSSTSAETAFGDATDGSPLIQKPLHLKDSTSPAGKTHKPYL
jgi:hypothetical protein